MPPAGPAVQTSRSDASPPDSLREHEPDEHLQAPPLDRRQADARRRGREAVEMRFETEGSTSVHAQRLERGPSSEETLVVRANDRLARIDEAATGDGERENRQTSAASGTRDPIAVSRGRAFVHDSSTSAAESESQTMPPPTQRWIVSSATANVRMVSARSKSPFP